MGVGVGVQGMFTFGERLGLEIGRVRYNEKMEIWRARYMRKTKCLRVVR